MTTAGESNDPYYDIFEDWDLIIASFLSQYGLRIRTKEFESVTWDEFRSLLAGIAPETPLGRVVAIRSERDKNIIKQFSPGQKKIYNDWRNRKAEKVSPEDYKQQMAALEQMMAEMCK